MQLEGELQEQKDSLEKYKSNANTLIRKSSELKKTEIETLKQQLKQYEACAENKDLVQLVSKLRQEIDTLKAATSGPSSVKAPLVRMLQKLPLQIPDIEKAIEELCQAIELEAGEVKTI